MQKYAGRVALVTGASSGIGAAVAQELQRQGLAVVGLARRVDRIKALDVKGAPGKLYAVKCDLRNEESILSAFKWIRENLKGVDILINNAALVVDEELTSAPTEAWRHQLDVNVLGLSICTREAVQDMLSRGVDDGFIIHINSIVGHRPPASTIGAMYSATKHAVKALLEGLRKDLVSRKSSIRVGEISPGIVKTEFLDNKKTVSAELYKQLPYLEPEDLAQAVVYVLSQPPRVQVYEVIIHPTGET